MWIVRRVEGTSMLPALKPGDVVIGKRGKVPQINDIVIAWAHDKEVIKRIVDITDAGYDLRGDNSIASTDSRSYGPIAKQHLKGVVIRVIKRKT